MENAAKALLMAGGILIGVLLITLAVAIFSGVGTFSDEVNTNIQNKVIYEFNAQFEIYNKRKDLTAQDIVTIINLANDYNKKVEDENLSIKVYDDFNRIDKSTTKELYEFIKENSIDNRNTKFECLRIEYDTNTKRVNKIYIKKL